jgi:dTDP-4-dehydrorhamnose reductase
LAITEVHNGCTREEQMRWTVSAWRIAQEARKRGVDIRAVTSWALFGSSGWDTLLTASGRYEAGAYDASSGTPRPTAMVPLLKALAADEQPGHPVLHGEGWWQRAIRHHGPAIPRAAPMQERLSGRVERQQVPAPVLIAGGNGTLGRALAAACEHRDITFRSLGREGLDVLDEASIDAALDDHRPWLVINAAGWVRVDDAEDDPEGCAAINAAGAERLARACAKRSVPSVHLSSDLVFDGRLDRAYDEADARSPLNVYGHSKAAAEAAIAALPGRHLMVRTAAFFSPFDNHNFAVHACRALARGEPFVASGEHFVTPTYVPDLCNAILDLAIDGEAGLWHLTNGEACSWAEFARALAQAVDLDPDLVLASDGTDLGWRAPRPFRVPLASRRGRLLPPLSDAIGRFARDHRPTCVAPSSIEDRLSPCR